jgi:hypothetical protein
LEDVSKNEILIIVVYDMGWIVISAFGFGPVAGSNEHSSEYWDVTAECRNSEAVVVR